METSKEKPRAGPPPDVDAPLEILRELLAIERDRLKTAQRIEKERKIVFPETTVIIRDIQKLMNAIRTEKRADAACTSQDMFETMDWDLKL